MDYKHLEQKVEDYKAAAQKMLADNPNGLDALQNAAFENLRGKIEETQAIANAMRDDEIARLTDLTKPVAPAAVDSKSFRDMPRGAEYDIRAQLVEGSGSGSYLVGEEWAAQLEQYRFENNFLRGAGATVIRTESTHNIPVLSAAGDAAFVAEGNTYTVGDPTVVNVQLGAYKLTKKVDVTEELLADSMYPVDAMLARAVGIAFGAAEEKHFLIGDGTGEPTGIFNKTADKTTAGATALTKDELIEITYGLARQYRDGAVWMMNDSTALYIAKLKLDVTTSGSTPYFWTDAVAGEPARLLGYPVFTNSNIEGLTATKKSIAFGNPREYVIGERGALNAKRLQLNEYADTFAFNHRVDGKPMNSAAFYVVAQHA